MGMDAIRRYCRLDVVVLVKFGLEKDERVAVTLTEHLFAQAEYALRVPLRQPDRWINLFDLRDYTWPRFQLRGQAAFWQPSIAVG